MVILRFLNLLTRIYYLYMIGKMLTSGFTGFVEEHNITCFYWTPFVENKLKN